MSMQEIEQANVPADTLALRLAIARIHAGHFNAASAARVVGVTRQTWSSWEKGQHTTAALRPWMLRHIAERLGVSEGWLRDGGPLSTSDGPRPPVVDPCREPLRAVTLRNHPFSRPLVRVRAAA